MLREGELSIIPHGDEALAGVRALVRDGRTTHILALDGGMEGGRPSVAIVVMSPDGEYCLLGQLSLRLFLEAADQLKAVHGDPRDDRGPNPIEIVPVTKSTDPAPEPPPVDHSARMVLGAEVALGQSDISDRGDGQQKGYVVLSDVERAKGFVRSVRNSYVHVGIPGPKYPLRDLTDQEKSWGTEYAKFEVYPPEKGPGLGKFWSQADLDRVGKGCWALTTMGAALAETYARDPKFYGGTFCVGCRVHLPVGEDGEFVWDGTRERVGT